MPADGTEMTWLPEQHEEQLQLGFRIIDNAFKNKIHGLEQEIRALVGVFGSSCWGTSEHDELKDAFDISSCCVGGWGLARLMMAGTCARSGRRVRRALKSGRGVDVEVHERRVSP